MKKKSKLLFLSLCIMLIVTVAFGCTKDNSDTKVLLDSMTISAGFLNEKYTKDDVMILEFS